jgi:hypothetical protein
LSLELSLEGVPRLALQGRQGAPQLELAQHRGVTHMSVWDEAKRKRVVLGYLDNSTASLMLLDRDGKAIFSAP